MAPTATKPAAEGMSATSGPLGDHLEADESKAEEKKPVEPTPAAAPAAAPAAPTAGTKVEEGVKDLEGQTVAKPAEPAA